MQIRPLCDQSLTPLPCHCPSSWLWTGPVGQSGLRQQPHRRHPPQWLQCWCRSLRKRVRSWWCWPLEGVASGWRESLSRLARLSRQRRCWTLHMTRTLRAGRWGFGFDTYFCVDLGRSLVNAGLLLVLWICSRRTRIASHDTCPESSAAESIQECSSWEQFLLPSIVSDRLARCLDDDQTGMTAFLVQPMDSFAHKFLPAEISGDLAIMLVQSMGELAVMPTHTAQIPLMQDAAAHLLLPFGWRTSLQTAAWLCRRSSVAPKGCSEMRWAAWLQTPRSPLIVRSAASSCHTAWSCPWQWKESRSCCWGCWKRWHSPTLFQQWSRTPAPGLRSQPHL